MRRQTLAAVLFYLLPVVFFGCTDESTAPALFTGSLRVTTSTTGDTLDWNGYALIVGAAVPRAIGVDATVLIANLLPGDVTVELGDVAVNCSISGDNPREVNIVEGVETETRFEIDCQAALFNRIAFSSRREGGASAIFVMEPDGSNPINLTRDPSSPARYPDWSPDATRIAFTSGGGGGIGDSDVYVINADGSNRTRLTQNAGVELSAWSPDGLRIAYSSFTEPVQGESWGDIYVINADGSNPLNLTPGPARGFDPAWSPDGSRIAFADDGEIWVMQADGSGRVQLTDVDDPQTAVQESAYEPRWSPDGTRIAFVGPGEPCCGIWVMDADGSNATMLVEGVTWRPAWSLDGTRIAYEGLLEVIVIDADGSNPVCLTCPEGGVTPAWSPSRH